MSKIFRLFKEGADTYENWHQSRTFPYNSTHLQEISDPEGDNARNEITSIPSPFARIDVAKHAFDEVNKLGMKGSTIYHKTVSDVFDVGEIFFNYDKFRDIIEIIPWSPKIISSLTNSVYKGMRFLGESLETYLKSDKKTNNFNFDQDIYILNYKGKYSQHSLDIIGATSPATVFFTSANDLSFLSKEINFGTDYPFDDRYNPLYNRDFEYVKAWFILRRKIRDFAHLMPEVNKYLDNTLAFIEDPDRRNLLRNLTDNESSQFDNISISDNDQAFTVEVFEQKLFKKKILPVRDSDFTIVPTTGEENHPLVLPVEKGNIYQDFKYTQGVFGHEAYAPYFENTPLGKRKLPYDGRKQDYLTISDFLEDDIIQVDHKLNSTYFVNAMTFSEDDMGPEDVSYLLPLKPNFFKYFKPEDLQNGFKKNKLGIKIDKLAAEGVLVTLQIPIKGHGSQKVMTYQRRYSGNADIEKNKGGIVSFDFDAFVMPLVRDSDVKREFYTVGCISTKSRNYTMRFFSGNTTVNVSESNCRNNGSFDYKAITYLISGNNFDYISVSNEDGLCGIIVPKFKKNLATVHFDFSVDVGTSNTHIAYQKEGSSSPSGFQYTEEDSPICTVFVPSKRIVEGRERYSGLTAEEKLIEQDYIPKLLGNGSIFNFPTRTDLSCARSGITTNYPFELYNASMTYDKLFNLPYNEDKTNIKWENNSDLLKDYISCLLLMIRNKVLLNDGNLAHTTVTWFFPTSMPLKRKNILKQVWEELYRKYITDGPTLSLTESSAPIYYLFKTQPATTNLINIDIGGETTDIAFAQQNKILSVSSFRFASNVLLENQLAPDNLYNGIVDHFKKIILKSIENCDPSEDKELLKTISPMFNEGAHANPANMASFLFSLKDYIDLKEFDKDLIDFNLILNKDENFKIVFILFYTAILYHIAMIIKYKNYELPNIISFSGNGSRLLRVISTNLDDLADYSLMVLKHVSAKNNINKLRIVGLDISDNPKTVTCLGGLKVHDSTLDSDPEVSLRADGNGEIDEGKSLQDVLHDEDYKKQIINSVKSFFKYVLDDLPQKFKYNFDEHFGVTPLSLSIAHSFVGEADLKAYLEKGINLHLSDDMDEKLSQTMFFLPIKGVLDAVSAKIAHSLNDNDDEK